MIMMVTARSRTAGSRNCSGLRLPGLCWGCGLGFHFKNPAVALGAMIVFLMVFAAMDDLRHRSQVIQPLNFHAGHSF